MMQLCLLALTAAGCMAAPAVTPDYGGTWSCPAAQHGATCNATCEPGLVGNLTATCNNGTWQVTGTECGITSEFDVITLPAYLHACGRASLLVT
jgi:hypothetical protein